MDICVQLTCGQGQHAGSVQHEENQAEIQHGFHFPPLVRFGFFFYLRLDPSSSCCCDVAFPLSVPPGEKLRTERKNKHGFKKLSAPDFIQQDKSEE